MSRLGTQKSSSRLANGCAFILEQCTETWSFWFEGIVFSAKCANEGFQKAMRHESKETGKVADSELNSPACGMNENRLVNAVKRSAHFTLFSQTSTSAECTDSSFSECQSPLTKGKVKGIIHTQGNTRKAMTGKARLSFLPVLMSRSRYGFGCGPNPNLKEIFKKLQSQKLKLLITVTRRPELFGCALCIYDSCQACQSLSGFLCVRSQCTSVMNVCIRKL
ncbi:hypothetical protein PO909_014887 [Leuciscus waleckii]